MQERTSISIGSLYDTIPIDDKQTEEEKNKNLGLYIYDILSWY